jgi:hypothetical protein
MNTLDFSDLQPIEIEVKVGPVTYILTEASGGAAIKYRNALMRASKLEKDKEGNEAFVYDGSREYGIADADAVLVSNCLYFPGKDGKLVLSNGIPDQSYLVPINIIRGWPVRVQDALYRKIKEISDGLVEREDTPLKNGQAVTTVGSA